MGRLIKRTELPEATVVELTVEGGMYRSENGMIHHNCDECRRLHLCPDNITPRAWYSSEVSSAYHDRNENVPSWLGLHPWERCVPAMIMPGFGFNDDGKVSFVATGFSELEYQRAHDEPPRGVEARREWFDAVEKSEMEFGEPLEKANHVPLRQKDFLRLIERFGWRTVGDNAHKSQAKHSVSGQTFRGFSHSDPSVLPPQKVKYYLGQLGMAVVPSPRGEAKFVARRGHPHEQFYRKVPGLTEDDFS